MTIGQLILPGSGLLQQVGSDAGYLHEFGAAVQGVLDIRDFMRHPAIDWDTGFKWTINEDPKATFPLSLIAEVMDSPNSPHLIRFSPLDVAGIDHSNARQFGVFMAKIWRDQMASERQVRIEDMLGELIARPACQCCCQGDGATLSELASDVPEAIGASHESESSGIGPN